MPGTENSFLPSIFLGYLDLFVLAGGGHTGLAVLRKYTPVATDVWSAGPFWYHQLLQPGSEWHFKIVTEGYRCNGDSTLPQNIVFYPLYPILARSLAAISGLAASDAWLMVSSIAGLLAIVLPFKLVREEFGDYLAPATTELLSFFSDFGSTIRLQQSAERDVHGMDGSLLLGYINEIRRDSGYVGSPPTSCLSHHDFRRRGLDPLRQRPAKELRDATHGGDGYGDDDSADLRRELLALSCDVPGNGALLPRKRRHACHANAYDAVG
ncbi:MAG: hypothetical protein WAV72_31195 [Bradyrhizobium sp.]